MAMKMRVPFVLSFVGDGVSTSFTANINTAPFQLNGGLALSAGFSPLAPSAVVVTYCDDHDAVGVIDGENITFTISSSDDDPPDFIYADGQNGQISGDLIY